MASRQFAHGLRGSPLSDLRLTAPATPPSGLPAAAIRETLEETGWHVMPTALVGVYRWPTPGEQKTFVRFAFAADARRHDSARPLDAGIVRALWLTYEDLVAQRPRHRSPLVLRCVDDYRAGRRWPVGFVTETT